MEKFAVIILFAPFGLFLILIGYYRTSQLKKLEIIGTKTKAKIISVLARLNLSGRGYQPELRYEFKVDNKNYNGKFRLFEIYSHIHMEIKEDDTYQINEPLDIAYLPKNPKINYPVTEIPSCIKAYRIYYCFGFIIIAVALLSLGFSGG